jgi:hypothetical protein
MISQPTKAWNIPLIDNIFLPFERDLIKQLPITHEPLEDQLMLPHTKNGVYSVKSGYNTLKHWHDNNMGSTSNPNPNNPIWKKIWSLPTIPRHKALLWRIANNSIPVRSALSHRGIQCSILCPRCLQGEETISHLFMECDRATRVWFGSNLGIKFSMNQTQFMEWLFYCISTLKKEDICFIAAIIYGIWWARNKMVFDNYDMEDKAIIEKAYASVLEYQRVNMSKPNNEHTSSYNYQRTTQIARNQHRTNQLINTKWRKPRVGIIKANSDANLFVDGWWGLGAIFRDESGQVLASSTWLMPGFNDPATAEACALYLTVKPAIDCCFLTVEFESDCAKVVDEINNRNPNPRNYLGNFIQCIRSNRMLFHSCVFSFIGRKANKVAHEIAALAQSVANCVWIEDVHPSIVPFVHMDLF